MAVASNFPAIRPSLNLDFANARALDPRITFSRASAATYYDGKTVAKAEENLLLNSAILATQSVTTRAEPYTLSFIGTGTVTLSGTSTAGPLVGTGAANRVSLTFTPTAGTLTLTVTGAVEQAQLEARSVATAYTPTTTQPITNYIPVLQTAPAGVPRFDHNPITGESLGLLVEEQRTNLRLNSSTVHGAGGTAYIGLAADIFGDIAARELQSDQGSSGVKGIILFSGGPDSGTNTASVFIKQPAGQSINLVAVLFADGVTSGNSSTTIPLVAGSGVGAGNILNWRVEPSVGGFFRLSFTYIGGVNQKTCWLYMDSPGTGPGTGKRLTVFGAQIEAGAFPTSYIKTEASQVTRAADSAAMTGANFSSWYRQDEGTLFADYKSTPTGGSQALFQIDDTTLNNRLLIVHSMYAATPATPGMLVSTPNVTQALLTYPALGTSSQNKIAGAYKTNDFSASFNSGVAVTDNSGYLPLTTRALIGAGIGGSYLNGTIKRIAYYPKRLTDAQLQALTA